MRGLTLHFSTLEKKKKKRGKKGAGGRAGGRAALRGHSARGPAGGGPGARSRAGRRGWRQPLFLEVTRKLPAAAGGGGPAPPCTPPRGDPGAGGRGHEPLLGQARAFPSARRAASSPRPGPARLAPQRCTRAAGRPRRASPREAPRESAREPRGGRFERGGARRRKRRAARRTRTGGGGLSAGAAWGQVPLPARPRWCPVSPARLGRQREAGKETHGNGDWGRFCCCQLVCVPQHPERVSATVQRVGGAVKNFKKVLSAFGAPSRPLPPILKLISISARAAHTSKLRAHPRCCWLLLPASGSQGGQGVIQDSST